MKLSKLSILFLPFIVSCSSNVNEGFFYLSDKYYSSENKGLIDDQDFSIINSAFEVNESFGLFVYSNGCTSCAAFKPILLEFLDKYNLVFLATPFDVMKDNSDYVKQYVRFTPGVVLFNEGQYVVDLDSGREEDTYAFTSTSGFTKWATSYILLK